jgi:hypothetical protein
MTDNVERFYAFMNERESIRLRKEDGQPWPWTEDDILRAYKFTNVRREHDATTRAFVHEFYNQQGNGFWCNVAGLKYDRRVVLLNCAIARYFGTIEFMRAVEWQTTFDPSLLKDCAASRLKLGKRVFTGAYVITNQGIKAPKQNVVVDHFLHDLWQKADVICKAVRNSNSWQVVAGVLSHIKGFGGTGFMTKEVLLDTMLCEGFWHLLGPKDQFTWTPVGPGARRGLTRLLGHAPPPATMLGHIRTLAAQQSAHWVHRGALSAHDIQFQLCEFDKYERTRLGQGRPRSKYRRPT